MVMENLRMASIGVEESAGGYESCKKKAIALLYSNRS